MTNTFIFDSDVNGLYQLTVQTNNSTSESFELNFTYGNLYTFLYNYNIDVIDENNKLKIINNSDNNYYITLKQLDKIIEIILGPKASDEIPIRLNVNSLFGPDGPCDQPLKSLILQSNQESDFEYLDSDVTLYFRNLDSIPKTISMEKLDSQGYFYRPEFTNNPTLNVQDEQVSFCLSSNLCEEPGNCDGSTYTFTVGYITDGGYYEVYVNDVRLNNVRAYKLNGNFKSELDEYGVNLIPLDSDLNVVEQIGNYVPGAEIGRFINNSPNLIRIKILPIDASPIETVYPDTGNNSWNLISGGIEFCLAPIDA